jgi:hypothetical protein
VARFSPRHATQPKAGKRLQTENDAGGKFDVHTPASVKLLHNPGKSRLALMPAMGRKQTLALPGFIGHSPCLDCL